jgi:hypothetical protein
MLQVTSKLCNACSAVVAAMPTVSKADADAVIGGVVDKLADGKVKAHASALLVSLAEVCTHS